MRKGEPAGDDTAAFVAFVVEQTVTRLGAEATRDEQATSELLRNLLADIGTRFEPKGDTEAQAREAAARVIAADPPLLAAVFTNLDVLFVDGATCADAMSAVTLRAMEISKGGGVA